MMTERKNIDRERERQIEKLCASSTNSDKQAIERGRRDGQRLRRELEDVGPCR